MPESVLRLEDVTMQFGGVIAVDNLSMEIFEGEIVALIGPNGAGKTTAFNAVTGVYEPTNGAVYFHDRLLVTNYPRGKMQVHQGRGPYPGLYHEAGHRPHLPEHPPVQIHDGVR